MISRYRYRSSSYLYIKWRSPVSEASTCRVARVTCTWEEEDQQTVRLNVTK